MSSGLLTSGSLFVLNVPVCWQWKGIPSGSHSPQVLNHFESELSDHQPFCHDEGAKNACMLKLMKGCGVHGIDPWQP